MNKNRKTDCVETDHDLSLRFVIMIILAMCFLANPLSGQDKKASVLLSSAIYEEEISGNLDKAIELYLDILKKYPDDRPVAAKTLYHLGLINEKMGRQKANEYYIQLISNYPEQKDMVALARGRLSKPDEKDVFTDSRDGHKYKYVTIGTQTWMAENLAYIPHVNPKMKGENGIWVYEYDGWNVEAAKATKNFETYGCLYDWPSAMGFDSTWLDKTWTGDPVNHQGICPQGWHLPTDDEWKVLEKFLGMPDAPLNDIKYLRSGKSEYGATLPEYPPVGRYLKADHGWSGIGIGDNRSGFNALPAGTRRDNPPYYYSGAGNWAYFWSASVADSIPEAYRRIDKHENVAWSRELPGTNEDDYRMFSPFDCGQSVRCVQNKSGFISKSMDLASHDVNTPIDKRSVYQSGPQPTTSTSNWNKSMGGNTQNTGFVSGPALHETPGILWSVSRKKINSGCLIANGRVFVSSLDSTLYCFDAESGKEIWRTLISAPAVTLYQIDNGLLIATAGTLDFRSRSILLIDAESGKVIWETEPGLAIYSLMMSEGIILYSRNDGYIVALDPIAKDLLWEKKVPHDYASVSLASEAGLLVIRSYKQNTSGTHLHVIPNYIAVWDLRTGLEKWEFSTMMTISSQPAIHGNRIFFGCTDRNFYSVDLTTGLKAWRFYTGEKIRATAGIAYDMVFFMGEEDDFYALDARTGRQIWKKSCLAQQSRGMHPALADSLVLFAGRDSCLYAVDAFTGQDLWVKKLDRPVRGNPMIYNGRIYYVSDETLYALE